MTGSEVGDTRKRRRFHVHRARRRPPGSRAWARTDRMRSRRPPVAVQRSQPRRQAGPPTRLVKHQVPGVAHRVTPQKPAQCMTHVRVVVWQTPYCPALITPTAVGARHQRSRHHSQASNDCPRTSLGPSGASLGLASSSISTRHQYSTPVLDGRQPLTRLREAHAAARGRHPRAQGTANGSSGSCTDVKGA